MPRVGRGHRRTDGALMFLEQLRAGLTPPELPGARCAQRDQDPELWFPGIAAARRPISGRIPGASRRASWAAVQPG